MHHATSSRTHRSRKLDFVLCAAGRGNQLCNKTDLVQKIMKIDELLHRLILMMACVGGKVRQCLRH